MKTKRILASILAVCMILSTMGLSVFADEATAVAKVGNTVYATIDEAIANWTNNTTLTLLADVTLSDVITLKSTEHHILNLGTYTMTAASGKNAIVIKAYGTGSAERSAITINADATNPGGINAGSMSVIYYKYADGGISTEDRPIIKINGGVFTGSTSSFGTAGIYSIGTAARKCATLNISGGTFNCSINGSGKSKLIISGGTFNYSVGSQGDSTANRLISGGTFKTFGFMTADSNNTKFWFGTSMGNSNVGVHVDDNGYIVVGGTPITDAGDTFEASSANYSGVSSYLQYSSAKDNGVYYTSVEEAFADNNKSTGSVTVYVDELDMTGISYKGTIVVPEGNDITIKVVEGTTPSWKVSGSDVTYTDADGKVLEKNDSGSFVEFAPSVKVDGAVDVEIQPITGVENAYNISLKEGGSWNEGDSVKMTFPAASGATDGDFAYVVHEHADGKYIYIGEVKDGSITITNNVGFSTFTVNAGGLNEALANANSTTGDVTVEIYGKVEYTDTTPNLTGSYDKISFVGKTDDAEISLTRNGSGGYIDGVKTADVYFTDLIISKTAGGWAQNADAMNYAFCINAAKSVTYTNCSFPNGSCAAQCETVYKNCSFMRSYDRYSLWTYGDNTDVTVDSCAFNDFRGIKMWSTGANAEAYPSVTVTDCDFSALTDKPAIVLTKGSSVTLDGNTYSSTGTFELDLEGSPNGVTVISSDAITCINDKGACGVLVDGKIYTTVAQAAEVATDGSTVTLLHNSTETVVLPEGVNLDKNGFTADGVTVEVPFELEGEGTEENPYLIKSLDDLKVFRDDVNSGNTYDGEYVELTGDINLSGIEWSPIGNSTNKFLGTFDGGNYTISNLVVSVETNNAGLFGFASVIKNVKLNNANVTGVVCVGALVGELESSVGTVDNCHVSGIINIKGENSVGGLAGKGYANIKNSSVDGGAASTSFVYGEAGTTEEGDNVGGIIGHLGEGNTLGVTNCIAKNITVKGTRKVGGIVGTTARANDYVGNTVDGLIIECTATEEYANKNASTTTIGGIIGNYFGTATEGGILEDSTVKNISFNVGYAKSAGALVGGDRENNGGAPVGVEASGNTITNVTGDTNEYFLPKVVTVATTEEAQAALDAATDGTTIVLTANVSYGVLYVGRPTKSNDTTMYCETHSYTTKDAAAFAAHLAESGYHTTPRYTTNLKNVTIVGADGATVSGVVATSAHIYGDVYDYVLDKDYDSGSAYYSTLNITNLTFSGVNFTGKVDINTSDATSVYDGVTFDGCTFTTGGTTSQNGAAIRYYNEANNGNVKNIKVNNCTFNNCYQGVYVHHVNGVAVAGSDFNTTGHNAIALQNHSGAVDFGTVEISGNTFTDVADRVIRFGDVGEGSAITIQGNTAINSGDEDGELIKATSVAESVSMTRTENTWNGYKDNELAYENGVLKAPTVTYVAKIGDVEYPDLIEALNIAEVSEAQEITVELLSDIDLTGSPLSKYFKKYHFITNVEGGVTVTFAHNDWVDFANGSIGENVTFKADSFLLNGRSLVVKGNIITDYLYTCWGAKTTIEESAVVNARGGSEATVQVKHNNTVMTVKGTLNCGVINVWEGTAKLIVSGANAKLDTYWFDCWSGTPSVLVENGATMIVDHVDGLTETMSVSRGGTITVDNANLKTDTLKLGHDGTAGVITITGDSAFEGSIKLTTAASTVTGPEGLNVTTTVEGYEISYSNGTYGAQEIKTDVAKIGDVKYTSLESAINSAAEGDTITMLADTTLTNELTLPAGIIFNGNGKNISGNIVASGDVTFEGHTKVTSFNAGYSKPVITIGEGACLELTGTGRMVIGHGATFNITGSLTDAKAADVASLTPSLIAPGASFTGAGVNFNVTNAYIKFTAYCSSKNSAANGTFNFNVTNSIWEQTGSLVFSEPTEGMDPTFYFNLKDSVLNSTSHLVFAVTKGEFVIDNSIVNKDAARQLENRSTLTIKNESFVNATDATSSNAKKPGTLTVDNATYVGTGEFSGSDVGIGSLILKNNANVTLGTISKTNITIDGTSLLTATKIADTTTTTVTIDATSMNAGEVKKVVDLSGTVSIEGIVTVTEGATVTCDTDGDVTVTKQATPAEEKLKTEIGYIRNLKVMNDDDVEKYQVYLVAGIDSLNYKNVGYEVKYKDQKKDVQTRTVYTSCTVGGEEYLPTVFHKDSNYIFAIDVLFPITETSASDSFTCRAFATKQNDDVIYTEWKTITGIYTK